MGSIEFLTTIFLVFRLYVLVRTKYWQPCPFSPNCECFKRYGNSFLDVSCFTFKGWPKFKESNHQYHVYNSLILTGDVSTIPADGLATFKHIHGLKLIQTGPRKSVQWNETAFKNVVVQDLEITNLAGVIPPPAALKPLGVDNYGFQMTLINVGEKIRLESNAFKDFPAVVNLTIENTEIANIDDNAFVGLHLKHLNLRSASLSSLPSKALEPLPQLKSLDLSGNRLSGGELPPLPPSVTWLTIRHNILTSIPKNMFANSPKLNGLYLRYNNISSVESREFPYATSIGALELSGNPITNINLRSGPASIWVVDLKDTKLRSIDLGVFSGTRLQYLYLSNTPTLEQVNISTALPPSIWELHLDNTGLKHIDPSIDTIFDKFGRPKLSLKNNKNLICDKGIHWLAKRLFCSPTKNNVLVEGSVCSNKKFMPLVKYLGKNAKYSCKD